MVSDVRARLRSAVAAPPGPHGRHVVSGRAIREDPGAAAIPVRAVDEDGDVIDILVQSRRNRRAARRFFCKLLKEQGREPRRLITDKLRSYSAAHRTVMPSVVHSTRQSENNRAEVSHQPTRQRERQMRRSKSSAHAQRFSLGPRPRPQSLPRGPSPALSCSPPGVQNALVPRLEWNLPGRRRNQRPPPVACTHSQPPPERVPRWLLRRNTCRLVRPWGPHPARPNETVH